MNTTEVLDNNHTFALNVLEDLPESEWDIPGACGDWSVKDVLAHLTAYELLLADILNTFFGEEPTPYVLRFAQSIQAFNDEVVAARRYKTAQQVLTEYQDAQVQTSSLLAQLPVEKVEQKGTMPWYNPDRSLADLIQSLSKHAREHCDQIAQFHAQHDDQHQ